MTNFHIYFDNYLFIIFVFLKKCSASYAGDVVDAPFSVFNALTLLSQAANGNTFQQLVKGLSISDDKVATANEFQTYAQELKKYVGSSTFSFVNEIYVQQSYKLNKTFQNVATTKFMSGIVSINFTDSSNSGNKINRFVESKTNNKIMDVISPGMITSDTRVIIVSAVYFKGNWKNPFNKNSSYWGQFYFNGGSGPVNFMNTVNQFNFAVLKNLNATALEMSYDKSNLSMVIVLPNNQMGLGALEQQMLTYDWKQITAQMQSQKVNVTIPKFQSYFQTMLNDILTDVRTYFDLHV